MYDLNKTKEEFKMNLGQVIDELKKLPKDKLLYDSINVPTWHLALDGRVVLAGSPCPIQTVGSLLHKLRLIKDQDYASRDNTFQRRIYDDLELHANTVVETSTGLMALGVELITHRTIQSWQVFSNDHMMVDVAIGGPSYMMEHDRVKVLVNRQYFRFLGTTGKRNYLSELLSVHGFAWTDECGTPQWVNKEYWSTKQSENCHCCNEPKITINNNAGGFDEVNRTKLVAP